MSLGALAARALWVWVDAACPLKTTLHGTSISVKYWVNLVRPAGESRGSDTKTSQRFSRDMCSDLHIQEKYSAIYVIWFSKCKKAKETFSQF